MFPYAFLLYLFALTCRTCEAYSNRDINGALNICKCTPLCLFLLFCLLGCHWNQSRQQHDVHELRDVLSASYLSLHTCSLLCSTCGTSPPSRESRETSTSDSGWRSTNSCCHDSAFKHHIVLQWLAYSHMQLTPHCAFFLCSTSYY